MVKKLVNLFLPQVPIAAESLFAPMYNILRFDGNVGKVSSWAVAVPPLSLVVPLELFWTLKSSIELGNGGKVRSLLL